MTVYQKIDTALTQHEKHKYCERSLDSIASYIDWAWKFRKITGAEKMKCVIECVRSMMKRLLS